MALVLLAGCLLLVSAIMQRTSQYQRRSESLLEAAGYADQVMDDVRQWARNPVNYDGGWSSWQGRSLDSATFPGMKALVNVQTSGLTLYSPDYESEQLYRLAGKTVRELPQAYVLVRVRAGRDLSSPTGRVDVYTMVASPSPQTGGSIVISGGTTLAPNGEEYYTATAYDGSGRELPQCCFDWHVHGRGGWASSDVVSRDGRRLWVKHDQTRWDDVLETDVAASGPIEVEAQARVMGKLITGTLDVTLSP